MINLVPPEQAAVIRYGRQNTVLLKWLIGAVLAIVGLLVIFAAGWIYINQQGENLQENVNLTNRQLQTQNLKGVQADAKEISGDIKVINQVLSNEIRFSDLIQAIGQVMPRGTVLGSLSLSKVNGALDLSANATDYATAAQIAANLSDSKNGLFSKVDIVSVNCTSVKQDYPCSTILKALFSPTTKNKFLSVPKDSGQ